MLGIGELMIYAVFAGALFSTLSASVAAPFAMLSLAIAGMVYAESVGSARERAAAKAELRPKPAAFDWRRCARSLLLGVTLSGVSVSGALTLITTVG